MKYSYAYVKGIFNTIPTGYYLGRPIQITLSETDTGSYFDPIKDMIVISYPCIYNTIKDIEIDDTEVESVIRGLVYHEISHVILTHKDMMGMCGRTYKDVINIVEDERIETICRSVYMNTNFRKNVFLINHYTGKEEPTNGKEAFYYLVRYHKVNDSFWLNRLHDIISRYSHLNAQSNTYDVRYYVEAVVKFYNDFMTAYENENKATDEINDENQTETSSQENTNEDSDTEETSNTTTSITDSDIEDESDDTSTGNSDDQIEDEETDDTSDETEDSSEDESNTSEDQSDSDKAEDIADDVTEFDDLSITKDEFINKVEKLINKYYDASLETKLMEIIYNKIKSNKKTGSAINSYSGRLNTRAIATRDDYKWWVQQNRVGHIRQYSKVHFNLFIDNSGSYHNSVDKTNTFIRSLDRLNIADFTFDVITINTQYDEWEDHNKEFRADWGWGNCLNSEIADIIRRHTKPNTNNYNIVLFDGDAHSDDDWRDIDKQKAFKYFYSTNTVIMTENDNKCYIENDGVKKANVKYIDDDYCENFINAVCEMLNKCL